MLLLFAACAPDPAAGAEVYGVYCSSCHGTDGAAGVQVDGVAATDLATRVPALSDDVLRTVIQDGGGAMPAQNLDDPDTADVIAWLREEFDAAAP